MLTTPLQNETDTNKLSLVRLLHMHTAVFLAIVGALERAFVALNSTSMHRHAYRKLPKYGRLYNPDTQHCVHNSGVPLYKG